MLGLQFKVKIDNNLNKRQKEILKSVEGSIDFLLAAINSDISDAILHNLENPKNVPPLSDDYVAHKLMHGRGLQMYENTGLLKSDLKAQLNNDRKKADIRINGKGHRTLVYHLGKSGELGLKIKLLQEGRPEHPFNKKVYPAHGQAMKVPFGSGFYLLVSEVHRKVVGAVPPRPLMTDSEIHQIVERNKRYFFGK